MYEGMFMNEYNKLKHNCSLTYEPSYEKTNINDSATQAYPDRHVSAPVDFLFQDSLLYTSIPLRRNVSARISLRGMRRLIWVDTLRRGHTVGFLV